MTMSANDEAGFVYLRRAWQRGYLAGWQAAADRVTAMYETIRLALERDAPIAEDDHERK